MARRRESGWRVLAGFVGLMGLLSLGLGVALNLLGGGWRGPALLPAVIGAGLVLLGAAANAPALVSELISRRTLVGANAVVMVLVASGLLGVVSYINARHHKRLDLTQYRRYTLSSKTRNIVHALDGPVGVTTFLTQRGAPEPFAEMYRDIMDILGEYGSLSAKLKIQHVDVYYDRQELQALAAKLNLDLSQIEANSVVFQSEGRTKHVPYSDIVKFEPTYPMSPYEQPRPQLTAEEAFTSAILSVTQPEDVIVYFAEGEGERSTSEFGAAGLSELDRALKRENLTVKPIVLLAETEVPEDCDVLVVAGPRRQFPQEAVDRIGAYLNRGGKLLAMLEPITGNTEATGLAPLLDQWGVRVREDVMVLASVNLLGRRLLATQFEVSEYGYHGIVEELRGLATQFLGAAAVDAGSRAGHQSTVLLRSPANWWGESDWRGDASDIRYDPDKDVEGPVAIGVAVAPTSGESLPYGPAPKEEAEGTRLLVFGDVDFAANHGIYQAPGNLDLVLNGISWLAGKSKQLGIAPRAAEHRVANLTPQRMVWIAWAAIGGLPGLCMLCGAAVWWFRRR